ncbi:Gfo/Idh/MocA family oxidoreductase [Paenibacillus taichungensis]|uniref:Gfo/Idh/MocA family protein n=1 Tax=Paenibacillus TaxID=44249 RepID=UPI000970202A|nr:MULTISPECIES: Gfo/Idh/MocA family oxidoreductase [Paenibacillus]MEC0111357.1 Gfo/Idh/MocA family oxidoreductase [Paenibacillus taichungensis]MEC0198916.1 Gfo/Idh/MocA family oxidoreductase [Paenibacillus taichungensis]OME82744.1 dehydrogenase [Paenibacillus pabuli]PIH58815.1 gfo/Idh/MocA family oxidoreductase [Paenibacillus sp. LK1]
MKMNNRIYNIAIVGFGGMGSYHCQLIEPVSQISVIGVYDTVEYRMELGKEAGYKTYANLDAVLTDDLVDIVLIATPNDVHKEIAIQALQAGKHVICEKPVTITSKDFNDIVKVANEEKRVFTVHQNRRWDEDFRTAKDIIDKKKFGELFHLESRVQGANGIPGDWRQLKDYGGGMLLDWGVHLLDQLLQITDSQIESVAANLSYILGTEVDDGFTSYITFKDGLTALIEVGTTNYVKLPRWYLKGTEGTAVIRDWDLSGEIITRNPDVAHIEPKPIQAGQGLTKTMAPPSEQSTLKFAIEKPDLEEQSFYENFVSVLEGKSEIAIKNDEVHRVLVLIETIFEAAETRSVIHRSI